MLSRKSSALDKLKKFGKVDKKQKKSLGRYVRERLWILEKFGKYSQVVVINGD